MLLVKGFRAFQLGVATLCRNRMLLLELTKREITDRHVGQILGLIWAVGHPLFLILVYVFLFGFVFKLRTSDIHAGEFGYTAYILAGLLPWLSFQEVLSRSTGVFTANKNLIKQVVFPIEVLPAKVVLAALTTQIISTLGMMVYLLVSCGTLPWTIVLLPTLWLGQAVAMTGVAFFLAPAGGYVRDLKEMVQMFCAVGIYLMPVVYLPQWVPQALQPLLYANPFSYMVWCYQDVCYHGRFEHPWAWPVFFGCAGLTFALGYSLFGRVKSYLGSIL